MHRTPRPPRPRAPLGAPKPGRVRHTLGVLALALAVAGVLGAGAPVAAQTAAPPTPAASTPSVSTLDTPLFYQLLIGEIEAREGRADNAVELILDAARRTGDDALFQRATEVAVQARAGDQALASTRAWRKANPQSREAVQWQLQVLFALGQVAETAEPLRTLLRLTPPADRSGLLAAVPRFYQRVPDKAQALVVAEAAIAPFIDAPETRTAARVAVARLAFAAGDSARALALVQRAHADEPEALGPVLLALELMPGRAEAEPIVSAYMARADVEPPVRLAYARVLTQSQRLGEAASQLKQVVAAQPELGPVWLSLGAHLLELRQLDEAEVAIQRYLALAEAGAAAAPPRVAPDTRSDSEEDDDDGGASPAQAWLLLSEVARARGDIEGARQWLARIGESDADLRVLLQQAQIMAREGRLGQARELIRRAPEREPADARGKLLAEAQLLREAQKWKDAREVLASANQRFPDDTALLYEQAMAEEKLDRLDAMETLLKRVMTLQPDHAHAYNALGYSLADRRIRLDEARAFIQRALQIAPGDPFITDSLGWLEYRAGNTDEAIRLLRQAYDARPDAEIAAHLGEVLWVAGRRDEARGIWRDARVRDAGNTVLRETLARLKVDL